jgi:hypothetical protein
MTKLEKFSFKSLLAEIPKDAPVDLGWLKERGVRESYASQLARAGYLHRLGAGVYCLPGVQLAMDASLGWIQARFPAMHVASKNALMWRGIRHNVGIAEKLVLWSESQFRVPLWFSERFPCRNHAVSIFDATVEPSYGISAALGKPNNLRVSEPERALLELFSEVGTFVSYEEARNLTENARNLRLNVLECLLSHCTRIKVVRLAHALADELDLPWRHLAQQHSERLGGGARWVLSRKTSLGKLTLKK